jgi:hypothetical protein
MTISLTSVAHAAAVSTMIQHLAGSDITFWSGKALNEDRGRETVAFVAEVGGFEFPVHFEAVIAVVKGIRHQFSIVEATGQRLGGHRYALDAVMRDGKLSASVFGQWLVTSPEVTDPDVVLFFERIVEMARKAKKSNFVLEANR